MMAPALSILGMGTDLPPAVSVVDYVESKGADTSFYKGWRRVCHAGSDDHPSTMGRRAFAQALRDSGVAKQDIRLVVFSGVSRDYPPSWSVATEIMRLEGMSGEGCVGIDLTIGCLGTLSALDFAQGWLAQRGGGCAAIVAAERWAYTVDHSNPNLSGIWAQGDGAGALIVGMNSGRPAIMNFLAAEFTSYSEYNGHVLIPYGGTRNPVAPPGANPYARTLSSRPRREIRDTYLRHYKSAYEAVIRRLSDAQSPGVQPRRLVCNQLSPQVVDMIAAAFGIPTDGAVATGHDTGHLGAADIIVGLARLRERDEIDAPIAIGASTAYAFGAGIAVPPA
jgi:3-oxoacyl-[acyl-carrier-protein] synthase-3